jgi:hypothetical protein
MASVTTDFKAKDSNFSTTVDKLQKSLGGFDSAVNKFNERASGIGSTFAGLGVKLAAGVAAFVGIKSAAEGMGRAFEQAGEFQQFERRFETLLGTTEKAQARMGELERFMDATPFNLPGIVQASQTLETLTQGALSTGEGLRMVGDTASATGQPIQDMATVLGRLYNGLAQGGTAVGDQTKRLVELGVITPQAAEKLKLLAEQGVGTKRAFDLISEATSKFSGEMQRQSTTWNATLEGLQDAINKALRAFAEPIIEGLTPQIQAVADYVRNVLAPAITETMANFTTNWLPKFMEMAQSGADYLRGLLNTAPSEMFKLALANMTDFARVVGDTLMSAFLTAVSGFGNALQALLDNDVPKRIGDVFGQAFMLAWTSLQLGLITAFDEGVKAFARLWESVSQMSSEQLLGKLMEVVTSFATGFGRAMIDPVGFIANNLAKGLTDTFRDTAHEFNFQYDKATGNWLEKTRTALENTAIRGGEKLGEAGQKLGDALLVSMDEAIQKTHQIEVNLLGSEEATKRMKERYAEMAALGANMRENAELAANATTSAAQASGSTPTNRGSQIDAEFAAAQAKHGTRGGGGGAAPRAFDPTTDYGRALAERGEQSVRFDPASSKLSSTGLAIERTKERFSVDKVASDIRSDLSRLENKLKPMEDRADRFEQQGMEGSAERLRGRADRLRAEKEKALADKYGLDLSDQQKTPEERKAEEEAMRDKHGAKGGGKESALEGLVSTIKGLCSSINEKLPQHALVPG